LAASATRDRGVELLTRHMLRKAAEMCRTARAAGHQNTIAVNVCLESLADVTFAQQVLSIVQDEGIDPHCIVLEVTESAATVNLGTVPENLAFLRIKGIGLTLDDYGTGNSSLEQLTWIPLAELKIDQSLVTHAARRESNRAILASSIDLAKRLNLRAVAEGVETREDWDLLRELKCDVAQGYYIARPMPADAYLEWLGRWPRNQGSFHSSRSRCVR
jgi:EAL domain-containing protein (putative c-di-GMP-specific phosphodiesterase class I)